MSPARISTRSSKRSPFRITHAPKPVTLPTFAFYAFAPVIFRDGVLLVGGCRKSRS